MAAHFVSPVELEFSYLVPQGFKDKSLSVYEASCVLYRYENRTGDKVSLGELETGNLQSKLVEDDYNIKDMVRFPCSNSFSPF